MNWEWMDWIDAIRRVLDPIILCIGYAILMVLAVLIPFGAVAIIREYRESSARRLIEEERQLAEARDRERTKQREREWAAVVVSSYIIVESKVVLTRYPKIQSRYVPIFKPGPVSGSSTITDTYPIHEVIQGSIDPSQDERHTHFSILQLPGWYFIVVGSFEELLCSGNSVIMKVQFDTSDRPIRAQVVTEVKNVFSDCKVYASTCAR